MKTEVPTLPYNVFEATPYIMEYLFDGLIEGKWYYAKIDWNSTEGPFETKEEANSNFQAYVISVRMCPNCEE